MLYFFAIASAKAQCMRRKGTELSYTTKRYNKSVDLIHENSIFPNTVKRFIIDIHESEREKGVNQKVQQKPQTLINQWEQSNIETR